MLVVASSIFQRIALDAGVKGGGIALSIVIGGLRIALNGFIEIFTLICRLCCKVAKHALTATKNNHILPRVH